MSFHSILQERKNEGDVDENVEEPLFFRDLNLDQVVSAITASRNEYNLKPFFHSPLNRVETIHYRHEVMRDLENKTTFNLVTSFARKLASMREELNRAGKMYYKYQKESLCLDAVNAYCEAIAALTVELSKVELGSRGLLAFRDYIANYFASAQFRTLSDETKQLKSDLSTISYCLLIKDSSVTVRKSHSERDYTADVQTTFKKFQEGFVNSYQFKFSENPDMNHIEAGILDFVAQLYPDIFARLDRYAERNPNYLDPSIERFDREVQFYLSYLDYMNTFNQAGLCFCYPAISATCKAIVDRAGFDLALAQKLLAEKEVVVTNDFSLEGKERIFVVSGPNQGGKTTFARTLGQLHYLASLGCPVAGTQAQLFLFDRLFTHFEKEEDIHNHQGKLEGDLVRIHAILDQATSRSLIILNEIFTSTTLKDALFLGRKVLEENHRIGSAMRMRNLHG